MFHPRTPTLDDLKTPSLLDKDTGLFHGVSDLSLQYIADNSTIQTLRSNKVLFEQSEAWIKKPIFIVLSGLLTVLHVWPDGNGGSFTIPVSTDGPGNPVADCEYLIRKMDPHRLPSHRPDITTLTTWSTIENREPTPAEILVIDPAEAILGRPDDNGHGDFQLVFNLAKILAVKLLMRSEYADPKGFGPKRLFEGHMINLISMHKIAPTDQDNEFLLLKDLTQAAIVADTGLAAGTVYNETHRDGIKIDKRQHKIYFSRSYLEAIFPGFERNIKI